MELFAAASKALIPVTFWDTYQCFAKNKVLTELTKLIFESDECRLKSPPHSCCENCEGQVVCPFAPNLQLVSPFAPNMLLGYNIWAEDFSSHPPPILNHRDR